MSCVLILLAMCAVTSAQYNRETWYPIEEGSSNGIDIASLMRPFQPITSATYAKEDEYVITINVPVDYAKNIVVKTDSSTRTVKVTAHSESLEVSYSRQVFGVSRLVPSGYSMEGHWKFVPKDQLILAFPRDHSTRFPNGPDVHSSVQYESGVGSIDGYKLTYSKSQFESSKSSSTGYGGSSSGEAVDERQDSVPIQVVSAASSVSSVAVWMSAILVFMNYVIY